MASSVSVSETAEAVHVAVGENDSQTADLHMPSTARGIVCSAQRQAAAEGIARETSLSRSGFANAVWRLCSSDLLTEQEEQLDMHTGHLRFDIELLTDRLVGATDWLVEARAIRSSTDRLFLARSTGGAAAIAARGTEAGPCGGLLVSRGGRPEFSSGRAFQSSRCHAADRRRGDDDVVIQFNQKAFSRLAVPLKELVIVPGASHLFERTGQA